MKNLWSEILVPVVVAGLTMAGTVGVEATRTVRPESRFQLLHALQLDTLQRDSVLPDTTKKTAPARKDTVRMADTEEDFDFFGENAGGGHDAADLRTGYHEGAGQSPDHGPVPL